MADAIAPGKLRDHLLRQSVLAWAATAPGEARAWVEETLCGRERTRCLQSIEDELAGRKPGGRQKQDVVQELADAAREAAWDDSKQALVENLAEKWAGEDFGAAREWALAQPDGDVRDVLLQRIAIVQVASDPVGAARLVAEEMPPGPRQDEAVLTVVHRWALEDPAKAEAWVNAFPEGALYWRARQELEGLAAYQSDTAGGRRVR